MGLYKMFFELAILRSLNSEEKKEAFSEDKSSKMYEISVFIFIIMYILIIFVLWVRVVISAFQCGTMEGISSLIFPSFYSLYKFGDLIKLSCNQLY